MKPQHIVATCLRVLAIAWVLYALSRVQSTLAFAASHAGMSANMSVILLVTFLQIAVCAVLWFFPMTIASWLLPGGVPSEPSAEPLRFVEWQTLGLICVGFWGIVDSTPNLVYLITYAALSSGDELYGGLREYEKAKLVSSIVELALGLWLVFGAKGLAAFLFKIRMGGVAK